MSEVKVIGIPIGLFCIRIEWALKFKGVEYEYLEEDLRNKSALLLQHNPVHKKMPVLLHHGKPIAESLVILEYLDEAWKHNPLLPEDPHQRAMARFWAKFADEKCLTGAWEACHTQGEEKEKAIASAIESFAVLEKEIEGKRFFGGEKIGYLDLALGWIPYLLNVLEEVGEMKLVDPKRFPSLHQWGLNFTETPLIKEHLPPRDKILSSFSANVRDVRASAASKK